MSNEPARLNTGAADTQPMAIDFDLLDANGYPTDEVLGAIKTHAGSPRELVEDLLAPIFETYGRVDVRTKHDGERVVVAVSTGGWSGCEEAISVLKRTMFWVMFWRASVRGGHFEFRIDNWWEKPLQPLNLPSTDDLIAAAEKRGYEQAQLDYLHPEFGLIWRETDGVAFQAAQEAKAEALQSVERHNWSKCTDGKCPICTLLVRHTTKALAQYEDEGGLPIHRF